jgi:hypothetical protein
MDSKLKHTTPKERLFAAAVSITLGFIIAVFVSNDTNFGYVSG